MLVNIVVVVVVALVCFVLGTVYGFHVLADAKMLVAVVKEDIRKEAQAIRQHVSDTLAKR